MHRLERQLCEAVRQQLSGERGRIPDAGRDLMLVFSRLNEARGWHRFGPQPVSYGEIEAFCRLMRLPLHPTHVAIIRAMDAAWVEEFYKKRDGAPDGVKTLPPVSKQPISAALLDAMFG